MKNDKPILEFFNDNPNTSYEIIFILDIDYSGYPYYYKVLVKDIKTNFYTTILIPPELLRYRYKIGNVYKGNKTIGKNTLIKSATFTIDTSNELQIKTLKEVISESDLNLVTYDYLKHFYLKQYCYSFDFDKFELIIPTYTIANRFYFLSSSMKKAIFVNSLSSLCEDKKFYKDGNTVFISVRPTAAKRDYPFICRFLENKDAKDNLNYFINQKSIQDKVKHFGQIKANFPTKEKFEIDTSYIILNKHPKPKILVLDIFNDSSSFNFNKIHVEKFTSKSSKSSISIDIPVNKKRFKKKISNKIEKTIKTGVPSSSYTINLDGDIAQKDRNTQNIEIKIEDIYKISEAEMATEFTDDIVNPTFENSESSGSNELVQSVYSFYGESENNGINIFNVNDFYILFNLLSQETGVEAISISDLITITPKENSKNNISTKYYLSSKKNRNYLYGDFLYNNKYIFIIEIELDKSWQGISTWFFIYQNEEDFQLTETIVQDIISYYIGECKSYDDLREYVCMEYDLVMYKKAHVKKIEEEYLLYHWVDDVLYNLEKIDYKSVIEKIREEYNKKNNNKK
ncbi:hypothetical protein [Arcobacter lacus]|uniref:Uncharacterized protein n=1 Tax=Arcobacter lacus TaxID=1912876 RepID=A0ABX5JPR1_9BACT|nr:hypothetical protein [Arcobacter lacus]PUE67300.1 hypothetical protein B0175_02630 [Arcobacter lacus]